MRLRVSSSIELALLLRSACGTPKQGDPPPPRARAHTHTQISTEQIAARSYLRGVPKNKVSCLWSYYCVYLHFSSVVYLRSPWPNHSMRLVET